MIPSSFSYLISLNKSVKEHFQNHSYYLVELLVLRFLRPFFWVEEVLVVR